MSCIGSGAAIVVLEQVSCDSVRFAGLNAPVAARMARWNGIFWMCICDGCKQLAKCRWHGLPSAQQPFWLPCVGQHDPSCSSLGCEEVAAPGSEAVSSPATSPGGNRRSRGSWFGFGCPKRRQGCPMVSGQIPENS